MGNFYVAIHDGSSVTDFKYVTVGTTTLTLQKQWYKQLRLYPYSSGSGHTLSVDSISVKGVVETEGNWLLVGTATVLPAISVAVTGVVGTTAVGSESEHRLEPKL